MSDQTGPLADLPPADRTLLYRAPLELAIAEVRFSTATASELPAEVGLEVRNRLENLGYRFPRLERAQEGRVSIQIQQGTEPTPRVEQMATGWQLQTADGRSQATIMPGALVLQTSKYERWSVSLRPVLEALLGVTQEVLAPAIVNRIGLRYVDRFVETDAKGAADWHGRVNETLLGPARHPILGKFVQGAQQQVELAFDDAHGALIRHGPFVDTAAGGAVSYLLDIDVFDTEPTRYQADDLLKRAETLNRTTASLFQIAITPEYLHNLQSQSTPPAMSLPDKESA